MSKKQPQQSPARDEKRVVPAAPDEERKALYSLGEKLAREAFGRISEKPGGVLDEIRKGLHLVPRGMR